MKRGIVFGWKHDVHAQEHLQFKTLIWNHLSQALAGDMNNEFDKGKTQGLQVLFDDLDSSAVSSYNLCRRARATDLHDWSPDSDTCSGVR